MPVSRYSFATLEDAAASRNRAWRDRMTGTISQAELYAILLEARRRYGQDIYLRELRR